ncbi:MAG: hypothetical protein IPN70_03660 [Candidatus Moraniibacteriota bacterium]|nr:MAG: hypothetical protein IPN70_03660 [Candidatus Moranbacteria bacterium]
MNPLKKTSLFWDVNCQELDENIHGEFIVSRILSFGNEEDVSWMMKTYTKKQLEEIFQKYEKVLDEKSRNYWFIFFTVHGLCIPKLSITKQSAFSKR